MRAIKLRRGYWLACLAVLVPGQLLVSEASAAEVTVQNDSLTGGDQGIIQAGFVAGESAASWLISPCDGTIVAVQVFWRSVNGTEPQSLEDSIKVFAAGAFPVPGAELAFLEGPVMTDSVINEFRYLDEQQTIPLEVPITLGEEFVVSFKFYNDPDPFVGPSVVNDVDGCQAGKNTIDAQGIGWISSCALGVTGDWVIRAVVDCGPLPGACCLTSGECDNGYTESQCASVGGAFQGEQSNCSQVVCEEACCFVPSGCLDMTVSDCGIASGYHQGPGTVCATTECFPEGACCYPDGTCDDDMLDTDCVDAGGTFQGADTLCSVEECPQPDGACCLSNDACLWLPEEECDIIPGASWAGFGTDCTDSDQNEIADDCEGEPQCTGSEDCDDSDECTVDTCDPNDPEAEPDGCVYVYQQSVFADIVPIFAWEPGAPPQPDLDDIICILDGFGAGANWASVCPSGDVKTTTPPGCGGDGQINLDDIIAVLDSFGGTPPCQDPCP